MLVENKESTRPLSASEDPGRWLGLGLLAEDTELGLLPVPEDDDGLLPVPEDAGLELDDDPVEGLEDDGLEEPVGFFVSVLPPVPTLPVPRPSPLLWRLPSSVGWLPELLFFCTAIVLPAFYSLV